MLDYLERFLDLEADFVEIRASSNAKSAIAIKDGIVDSIDAYPSSSYSVRVFLNSSIGFATANQKDKLPGILSKAVKMARASPKTVELGLSEEKAVQDRTRTKFKTNPQDISIDDKVKDLMEYHKLQRIDGRNAGTAARYSDFVLDNYYLNSEGSRIWSQTIGETLSFNCLSQAEGTSQIYGDAFGSLSGYEFIKGHEDKVRLVSEKSIDLLGSKRVDPGEYDVVLSPAMAGLLAHEAAGHASEADYVLDDMSCLKGKAGEKIGSERVTIIDDPTLEGVWGHIRYDDEGVEARRKELISKGIVNEKMHSRETAFRMNTASTGNARAQGPSLVPLVRMTNTHFGAGDFTDDEIMGNEKFIYVDQAKGGTVSSKTGEFQFAAMYATLHEGGKETVLRDMTLAGNLLDFLGKIDAFGKRVDFPMPGMCGKGGQSVRVGTGAPLVRARGVKLG